MQALNPIPLEWAARGHCPLCGAGPLQAAPDHLACARCGTAFEVEAGGPHLRLIQLPAALHTQPDGVWRTTAEARAWARAQAQAAQTPPAAPEPERPPAPVTPADPVPADALARAQELFRLRHTPAQIRAILERSPEWTPAQIEAVMAAIQAKDQQVHSRQTHTLAWVFGGVLGITLILAAVVAVALLERPAAQPAAVPSRAAPGGNVAGAAVTQSGVPTVAVGDLPAPLQTLLPPGAQVINPTPVVRRLVPTAVPGVGPGTSLNPSTTDTGPGTNLNAPGAAPAVPASGEGARIACPATSTAAAELFGGAAKDWRYDSASHGWMMFTSAGLIKITVPAGMTGGYMEFGQALNMQQVDGPAEIDGVNMIVISCN